MKKLILAVGFLAVMGISSITAEVKYGSFGAHISIPMTFGKLTNSIDGEDWTTRSNSTSLGIGIDALTLFSERVGIFVDMDFVIPLRIKNKVSVTADGVELSETYTQKRSDYTTLSGFQFLIGPVFAILHSEKNLLTVGPGIHMRTLKSKPKGSRDDSSMMGLGLGAAIHDTFSLGQHGYIKAGCDFDFDFFELRDGDSGGFDFTLSPYIGGGFRF